MLPHDQRCIQTWSLGLMIRPKAAPSTFDIERIFARSLAIFELLLDEHQALLVLLTAVHQMQLPVTFLPQGADIAVGRAVARQQQQVA